MRYPSTPTIFSIWDIGLRRGILVDSVPIINKAHAKVLTGCGYNVIAEANAGSPAE